MKCTLNAYRFNIGNKKQEEAWKKLEKKLKATHERPFISYHNEVGYKMAGQIDFEELVRDYDGYEFEIDDEFVFKDQLNTHPPDGCDTGLRLFDWRQMAYPNENIKAGYYLTFDDEFITERRTRLRCAYCGEQYRTSNDVGPWKKNRPGEWCKKCLGSRYLKEDELHLTMLVGICDDPMKSVPEWAKEGLLHDYKEAQKLRIEQDKERHIQDIELRFRKKTANAKVEHDGFMWLLKHDIDVDNVIFYDHTSEFCFGWRTPFTAEQREAVSNFPYKHKFK